MSDFASIDAQRMRHGLTRRAVYERAGINGETWRRTAQGRTQPNIRTLQKLRAALDALIAEKDAGHGVVAHARSDNDRRSLEHGK